CVACHRRPRSRPLEREIARCFDAHVAVAGEDGHYTGDEPAVDVTLEQVSQPSQPLRREPTSGSHLSPPHLVRFASYMLPDDHTFREDVRKKPGSERSPWDRRPAPTFQLPTSGPILVPPAEPA